MFRFKKRLYDKAPTGAIGEGAPKVKMTAQHEEVAIKTVNAIRKTLGGEYEARIPEATRQNITEVGNTFTNHVDLANKFIKELFGRIGKVIVDSTEPMEDIYSVFGQDTLPMGDTIQKIYMTVPKAKNFDGTATTSMLSQESTSVHVEYTRIDRKFFYKKTVKAEELKEAFISPRSLAEFIYALVQSMVTAYNYDVYVMFTEALRKHADDNYTKLGAEANLIKLPEEVAVYNTETKEVEYSATGAKDLLKAIKKKVKKLKFPHDLKYKDSEGVTKTIELVRTSISNAVLALELDTMVDMDVDALAVLFHLEKAQIEERNIELDNNALGETTDSKYHMIGFICNKKCGERYTSFTFTDTFRNGESLAMNYWNHYWGAMAISKFYDFVPILVPVKAPAKNA